MNPFLVADNDTSTDWRHDSLCAQHSRYWEVENLPEDATERAEVAQAMCERCPVIRACAQWHRGNPPAGMVVAAMAIEPGRYRKSVAKDYLAAVASGAPVAEALTVARAKLAKDQYKYCADEHCGIPMLSRQRWLAAGRPEGVRETGGLGLCSACYARVIYFRKQAS